MYKWPLILCTINHEMSSKLMPPGKPENKYLYHE